MSRRYTQELENLVATFGWTKSTDLEPIRCVIAAARTHSIQAIGSGGSLTVAHMLALLHRRYSGNVAAVSSPLEAMSEPLKSDVSTWLLTASGSNADILAAAKVLVAREPNQLAVLCGRPLSRLADLCRKHPFVDLLLYEPPGGKDGFLATNGLFAFASILARAYTSVFCCDDDWKELVECLEPILRSDTNEVKKWAEDVQNVLIRPTTIVLHGSSSRIGAIDIESKFTEAALGNVQIADYRNFAHGRHYWLAQHPSTSSILALIADDDRDIAERTLKLIPKAIPQARISLVGGPVASAMASVVAALRITQWFGTARDIDPGKPGVPEFGRRIYRLRPTTPRPFISGQSRREYAAIVRKSTSDSHLEDQPGEVKQWSKALHLFLERLRSTSFGAVVLDYDGTIVDTRDRFALPTPEICAQIIRLSEAGVLVGIASGRGKSVRQALQKRLPNKVWPSVFVGYYNGAEVATLDNDGAPDKSTLIQPNLQPMVELLRNHPDLSRLASQENRPFQISLTARRSLDIHLLWLLVNDVVQQSSSSRVVVVRSGHSVDLLAPHVSKREVVRCIQTQIGNKAIMTIGDRGRWPGNDYELLGEPFALSVDEVNTDPTTCWNVGHLGQRGSSITIDYLSSLTAYQGSFKFALDLHR